MVSFMSYLFKYILTLMNLTKIREGRKKKWVYKNIPPPPKKKPWNCDSFVLGNGAL